MPKTPKPKIAEGQIWRYGDKEHYRLERLRPDEEQVSIVRVTKDGGHWVNTGSSNENYLISTIRDSATWVFLEYPMRECGECGQTKPIAVDDFLCAECREAMPMVSRLVADVDDNPTIIQFSSSPSELVVVHDGRTVRIRREDMPGKAEEALKKFLNSA